MRPFRLTAALAACAAVLGACVSGGRKVPPTVSPAATSASPGVSGPVTDSVPYWCDLVPRGALSRVSGVLTGLSEIRNSGATRDRSICGVRDKERYGPLVVQWNVTGGRDEIATWLKDIGSDHPIRLPSQLGVGFSVYSQSASRLPYFAASTFDCGPHDAWIELFLRRISSGRNATRDLTDLMRIAQKRFGELHRCTPAG